MNPILFGADALAVGVLVFGLYFPRHRRRDLVAAFLGVNIGVMAVSSILTTSAIGAGVGLGLFGVLSIIRLRSDELAQHEIAYYFSALALGLLGGLASSPVWLPAGLMSLIVVAMFVGDHPRLLRSYRRQLVVLDRAIGDEDVLRLTLAERLGGAVVGLTVVKLDLVTDTTTVDVRYRTARRETAPVPGDDRSETLATTGIER